MKLLITLFLLPTLAFANSINGKITYKHSSGDLVERAVIIDVPTRGQGEVVLSGPGFQWRTDKFKSYVVNGEAVFVAVFKTQFRNFKSTIAFKGTYLKGNNQIIYSGNFYKKTGHFSVEDYEQLSGFEYNGNFRFNYLR